MNKLKSTILSLFLVLVMVPAVHAQDSVKQRVMEKLTQLKQTHPRAAIGSCILATKVGTTLTCTKGDSTYTLDVSLAKISRRFGAKATLDELTIGDTLSVVGTWADATKTSLTAKVIRDISIQKRHGTFVGTVKSVSATGWVMTTVGKRTDQTVVIDAGAKIVDRKQVALTQADVTVGDRVYVKGLWNNTTNTITEVTNVKDFSKPAKAQ